VSEVDIPLSVAAEELLGWEVLAIERHYGAGMENLSGSTLLIGCVWAFSNRTDAKRSWVDVEAMSLKTLGAFFAPEPAPASPEEAGADFPTEAGSGNGSVPSGNGLHASGVPESDTAPA
jgi:hypothetical protein